MTRNVTRRSFLRTGCITAAAIGVTAMGGGVAALTAAPRVAKPTYSYGEESMTNRILVAYATKAGSTAEVAARVGEILGQHDAAVDVLPIGKVKDLSPYQQVVLGSAIRIGNVLPEVTRFIQANQGVLQRKSLHMFVCCMTLEKETPENRATVSAYLDPIRALVQPASEGLFAGVMDLKKISLLERMMMKTMKTPTGDFRDWEAIGAWAKGVAVAGS